MDDANARLAPRRHEHDHTVNVGTDCPIELKIERIEIEVTKEGTDWFFTIVMLLLLASLVLGATVAGFTQRIDCALGIREACAQIGATYSKP